MFSLLFFTSCKTDYSPEVQKLYDEVMVIHDEVMPEMGTIHKLKKQLKSVVKDAPAEMNLEDINKNIKDLDFADESMMDWMHQFKVPKDATEQVKLDYLKDQKLKMSKVNSDMKTIIKTAQNALSTYK